jgi:primosomal protein N' (replication factor Y)
VPCGPGVERIHELIAHLFPNARCTLLTSDLVGSTQDMHAIIDQIARHEVDIIIGTQILAKGHHFPLITLVGVIDGDLGIGGVDLRACERSYQLLHQVSGRAGREQKPGRVFLQTFTPDHPVMQALASQDRDQFLELEQSQREQFNMPPFGRLAALIVSGAKAESVDRTCEILMKSAPRIEGCTILGPTPAPLALLRGKHRRRFLLKSDRDLSPQKIIYHTTAKGLFWWDFFVYWFFANVFFTSRFVYRWGIIYSRVNLALSISIQSQMGVVHAV